MESNGSTYKRNHMIGIRHSKSADEVRQQGGVQPDSRHNLADINAPSIPDVPEERTQTADSPSATAELHC